MNIAQGSKWQYIGDDGSPHIIHNIVAAGKFVTTWSDPVKDDPGVGGFSWFGPLEDFIKQFKPTKA